MLCPTLCIEFTKHLKSLQARVDADALATMQGVVEQLARFAGAGEAVVREQAVCGGGPEDDDGGIIRETGRAGL